MLINKGCYNPTPSAGTRWSMYSYNLELAEDKPATTPSGSFAYSPAIAYCPTSCLPCIRNWVTRRRSLPAPTSMPLAMTRSIRSRSAVDASDL